jgi:hypothetical protein
MNSAKQFWTFIGLTILLGIGYMLGAKKLIDWVMDRRRGYVDSN